MRAQYCYFLPRINSRFAVETLSITDFAEAD